jgi:hypothetical protein
VGKAKRAHRPLDEQVMVGTAQVRLCPPYGLDFQTANVEKYDSAFSRRNASEVCQKTPALIKEGAGMPGADAPAAKICA